MYEYLHKRRALVALHSTIKSVLRSEFISSEILVLRGVHADSLPPPSTIHRLNLHINSNARGYIFIFTYPEVGITFYFSIVPFAHTCTYFFGTLYFLFWNEY